MERWKFQAFLLSLIVFLSFCVSSHALLQVERNTHSPRARRLVPHRDFWRVASALPSTVREELSQVDPFMQYEENEKLGEELMQGASDSKASESGVKLDSEGTEEQLKDEEQTESVDSVHPETATDSDEASTTETSADSADSADSSESGDPNTLDAPADSIETSESGNAGTEDTSADSAEADKSSEEAAPELETRDGSENDAVDTNDPSVVSADENSSEGPSTAEETKDQGGQLDSPSDARESATDLNSSSLLSNSTTGKNDTNAFMAFKLRQMLETDSTSSEAFHLVTIFEEGAFTGPFADSPSSTNIDAVSSSETEKWYRESAYADRISFRLDYTPESSDYKIVEPVIAVTSETGIEPVVQDFQNDPENGEGSFSIVYSCTPGGPEKSYISLHLQVTSTHSIDTAWTKVCGRGRYEHIEFGFTSYNLGTVLFNRDGTYGTEEQKTLEVGPLDTSTELTMKLAPPAYTLDFKDPFVASDSDYVSVALRGMIAGGTVNSDEQTKFSILYECQATATANIVFSVAIPPWDNMTAVWRKDCGGKHSQSLLIGTSGPGSFEVVHEGEVSPQYNVSDNTYIGSAHGAVEEIPGNKDYKMFFITNSDDTSEIQVQTVSLTMSDPTIVTPIVQTSMVSSSKYISASGGVIGRKETKQLYLHFICKREGKSLILVTLPILRYRNIEFGFMKECFEPKVHRHSGFLQTAGSIMGFMLLLAVVGGGAGWVYWRRRSRRMGKKYTAVPTNEQGLP
ncbi:hypothetical protein FGB62_17g329 [Gracilaria domingensis]|nr:hypothetical protein FGB62_17g329 [Gracilaria domingensis]